MNKEDWIFKSSAFSLAFSSSNGAILSGLMHGRLVVQESFEAFRLGFRLPNNQLHYVSSDDFKSIDFQGNRLCFHDHAKFPMLRVEIKLDAVEENTIEISWSGSGFPDGWRLETSDIPVVTIPAEGSLLHPRSEGGIIWHPEKRKYTPPDIQDAEYYIDNYPGRCQMQFMAHWDADGYGVYFAAHDVGGAPKRISYSGVSGTQVRLGLETFCGGAEKSYECPFAYVLAGFCGDWITPCEIYRSWVEKELAPMLQPHFPEWAESSPITLIYPVCGDGTIKAEPNQYFPYVNGLPYVEKMAERLQSRIMALLMRWDGHGPWLPPEVWPPLGGEEPMLAFARELHRQGHLLGLYGSGTAFTLKSYTNDYEATEQFEKENLATAMCANPDGTLCVNEMAGIRTGYYLCTETDYCRKVIRDQIRTMARAGIDYLQFFDQNLGCCNYLCYSNRHGHPQIPGKWSTDSMRSLLAELNAAIRSEGSKMLLGTEGAAAECFMGELPFNDLRSSMYFAEEPIPAYSYVFHHFTTNFMGNQVHFTQCVDHEKSPHDLLFRIAWSFITGAMLSVPMRENGLVDWGNDGDWSIKPPDQETALTLLRNLNACRRKCPQALLYGRMARPKIGIKTGKYDIWLRSRCIAFDSVLTSAWICPNGEFAQIFVNYLPWPQEVKLSCGESSYCVSDDTRPALAREGTLKMEALTACVLFERNTK
ncbi:MAG: hypothetical protein IJJ33_15385 [Victivallales bacterium]|nr:hypothetical protein [Victivallales bacterium]